MKKPGLDGRHRDKDGEIQQKRSDTLNKDLSRPIPPFSPDTTLGEMRKKTGKISETAVRRAAAKLGSGGATAPRYRAIKPDLPAPVADENRLRERDEVLARVADWTGGPAQAMAWYRAEPIPAFGGRTAEALVKSGQAGPLRDYLDSIALGGFA
jgi:hypothetical protein